MIWRDGMSRVIRRISITTRFLLLAFLIPLASCGKSDKPSSKAFASPDEAGQGLLDAAKSGDENAIQAIFGPGSKEIISSGDAAQDKATVDKFVAAYGAMHRWRKMPDEGQILIIG